MERTKSPTEETQELLRGMAKALEREMVENPEQGKRLSFLRASVLDCYEAISGQDSG